jgi:hypothetical protein
LGLANSLFAVAQDEATNGATPLAQIKVTTNKQTPNPNTPLQSAALRRHPKERRRRVKRRPGRRRSRKTRVMDRSRENLLPKVGASSYTLDCQAIETLPQGENTAIDKVILQIPGVCYDSTVSNRNFHVRNEYANSPISQQRHRAPRRGLRSGAGA